MNEPGKRWGLVVIDLQRDLCYDDRRKDLVDKAIPKILTLIDAFVERRLPRCFTKFELDADDPQFERFGDRYCIRGTPGAEFIEAILPLQGEVVSKTKHSAFFDTDLEDRLRRERCDGVVLAGLQTQICILTTAADAHHRGFDVVAASDGVISTRDEVRLEALEWIDKYVGRTLSTEQIMDLL
jgi:nicotinamidase-related amidase